MEKKLCTTWKTKNKKSKKNSTFVQSFWLLSLVKILPNENKYKNSYTVNKKIRTTEKKQDLVQKLTNSTVTSFQDTTTSNLEEEKKKTKLKKSSEEITYRAESITDQSIQK